jgi:Na+-exporting ATPase
MTILLMMHSLECKHLDMSIFQMNLLDNKFLLWSAFALSLTVFPIIYIPRISDYAFQTIAIGWEWGIVFGMIFVYLVVTELYKLAKRRLRRGEAAPGRKMTMKEKNLPRFETMAP